MNQALFLDRDGTIIIGKDFIFRPEDVELLPGVKEALRQALTYGYLLFLFTNQSGVNRGLYSMEDVAACNQRMLELLELPSSAFTDIGIAPERPDEPRIYRKPSPQFIIEMIERHNLTSAESWMVGDQLSDLESGLNAGIQSALVTTGKPVDTSLNQFAEENRIRAFPGLAEFVSSCLVRKDTFRSQR